MRLAFTLIGTACMCAWCMVVWAWMRYELSRSRARATRSMIALRRRHDRELADIRGYLVAVDPILRQQAETDLDDLAWQHDPVTQPIQMPAPEGPPTAPADVVLIGKWAEDMPHLHGPAATAAAQDIEEQIQAIRARSAERLAARFDSGAPVLVDADGGDDR